VAYLAGYLKADGYTDLTFIDAMTNNLTDEQVRDALAQLKPDIIGATSITPSIYKAERLLQVAKEVNPAIVTVLGGIHGTFMYPQVLTEAPWIDAVVRGEGEQVFLNLIGAIEDGSFGRDRGCVRGIAYLAGPRGFPAQCQGHLSARALPRHSHGRPRVGGAHYPRCPRRGLDRA
jgi:anaerobic magnesium-protoporphyrin IX monomethyl ester cyclase